MTDSLLVCVVTLAIAWAATNLGLVWLELCEITKQIRRLNDDGLKIHGTFDVFEKDKEKPKP